MSTKKTKEKRFFLIFSAVIITCCILLLSTQLIAVEKADIYNYILTISSVMGGFMFAGLGIMVSAITSDTIKRFWDGHYLDNLYRASIGGLVCDVIAMVLSFLILYVNDESAINILTKWMINNPAGIVINIKIVIGYICIGCTILGLVYFVWSCFVLLRVFKRLKKDQY